MKKNKKSQIVIWLVWFGVAVLFITVVAVLAPFGVLFNTKMYEAGEKIYLKTNATLNITNTEVRNSVQNSINSGFDALATNIDVNADMFQYGWIAFLILSSLVVFVYVLRIKQIQGQGGII